MYEYRYYENKRHGSSNFPFQIYKVEHTKDTQQILPIHWHDEMEFIFLDQGHAVFRIEERDFPIHSGEALIVHPGELHSGYNAKGAEITYYSIVFKLSWITSNFPEQALGYEPLSFNQQNKRLPTYLTVKNHTHVQLISYIKHILQKHETKHAGYPFGLKGLLLMFFSYNYEFDLLEEASFYNNKQSSEERKLIKKVLSFMEEHFQEKIELDHLASVIAFSRSHFCRFFKNHTGMRPLQYLNYIRINNAANMLRDENCTVLEAAMESGFHHHSYFTKQFKKIHHITPSEYKALHSSSI